MEEFVGLFTIFAGIVGGTLGARPKEPAWKGIIVSIALILSGGSAGLAFFASNIGGVLAYILSFAIGLMGVVFVGSILKIDQPTAQRIVLGSILGMMIIVGIYISVSG